MKEIKLTDIKGIKVGHAQNKSAGTGCTVIMCEDGAVAGVDVRGGGPATRETDLLNPVNMVQKIHAVILSGGSAFGLDAASGVMQYFDEHNIGFPMQNLVVPIVCGASLFDLFVGDSKVRPDKQMGYEACMNANDGAIAEGNVGAGTGASVGKLLGPQSAMKSGLGTYALEVNKIQVGAIVAVNACGNVFDDKKQEMLAGIYHEPTHSILSSEDVIMQMLESNKLPDGNTTIGCIVTNAKLDKAQCTKIASIAHNAYAKAIRPVHTMSDGDTIFVLSTGEVEVLPDAIGVLAVKVMEEAIYRSIKCADSAYGLKSYNSIKK